MATREVELIQGAIAATEKEIFGDAFGNKEPVLDDTGDRSQEQMGEGLEGQHEPDEDEDAEPEEGEESEEASEDESEEGEDEGKEEADEESEPEEGEEEPEAEAKPADKDKEAKPEGRVPSGRLREQTERAEKAERELRAFQEERERERGDFNRRFDDLNGRFATLLTTLQTAQPGRAPGAAAPDARAELPPDPLENPQGFIEYQNRQRQSDLSRVEQTLSNMRFQTSMDVARAVHKDKFEKAWEAVNKLRAENPDEMATARQIYTAPNPGEALMKWHARNETLRIVGDDPDKYRETVSNELREALKNDPEFRAQLLEDMRAEATGEAPRKPKRSITRLPKSLNGATGQSQHRDNDPLAGDDSDSAVFESAWR